MAREGLAGRHAVLGALQSTRHVHSVLIDKDAVDRPEVRKVIEAAGARGIRVSYVTTTELGRLVGASIQGVGALADPLPPHTAVDLLAIAKARGEPAFILAVDGIEDPQNLGAIARTALLAGCHGLIVPDRGTAAIGPGAHKAASGAFSQLAVAQVANLRTALENLKREGVWILGADAGTGKAPWTLNLRQPVCLVLGSESAGLSAQALAAVEERITIPTPGGDLSLNVSAAAAILAFEHVRQAKA